MLHAVGVEYKTRHLDVLVRLELAEDNLVDALASLCVDLSDEARNDVVREVEGECPHADRNDHGGQKQPMDVDAAGPAGVELVIRADPAVNVGCAEQGRDRERQGTRHRQHEPDELDHLQGGDGDPLDHVGHAPAQGEDQRQADGRHDHRLEQLPKYIPLQDSHESDGPDTGGLRLPDKLLRDRRALGAVAGSGQAGLPPIRPAVTLLRSAPRPIGHVLPQGSHYFESHIVARPHRLAHPYCLMRQRHYGETLSALPF